MKWTQTAAANGDRMGGGFRPVRIGTVPLLLQFDLHHSSPSPAALPTVAVLAGAGGFAYVSSVEDCATGELMAVKRMLCQDREARDIAEKEIQMLVRNTTEHSGRGERRERGALLQVPAAAPSCQ